MRSKEVEEALVKLDIERDVLRNSIDKANYDEEYRNEIDLEDFKETKQAIETALNYISELEEKDRHRKYLLNNKKFYSEWYMGEIICCEDIKNLLEGE